MATETMMTEQVAGCDMAWMASILADAIDQCLPFVRRDDSRPALTGVYFRERDKRLVLVAVDGFRLIEVSTCIEVADFAPRIYTADSLKRAVKAIRSYKRAAGNVFASLAGDILDVLPDHESAQSVTLQRIEARYPNYEEQIPSTERERSHFAMAGSYIEAVGKLAARYSGSSIARVYPGTEPMHPVRFDWQMEGSYSTIAVVMPIAVRWN